MKKGSGKIVAGVVVCLFVLIMLISSEDLSFVVFASFISVALLVWGWRQQRDPDAQKRFTEKKLAAAESLAQVKAAQRIKDVHRQMRLEDEKRQASLNKEWERSEKEKKIRFSAEGPRLTQIITESVEIINKTKNVDTAITRFDTIREMLSRLFEITPATAKFSINIWETPIHGSADLGHIDYLKKRWIELFFKSKIINEMNKGLLLNDTKLKSGQYRKALNIALKAIDYLHDSTEISNCIANIEQNIEGLKPKKMKNVE